MLATATHRGVWSVRHTFAVTPRASSLARFSWYAKLTTGLLSVTIGDH